MEWKIMESSDNKTASIEQTSAECECVSNLHKITIFKFRFFFFIAMRVNVIVEIQEICRHNVPKIFLAYTKIFEALLLAFYVWVFFSLFLFGRSECANSDKPAH